MSMQRPAILFVGNPDTGAWLQDLIAPQNGYVYQPGDLLEALAMYVSYFPDAIVLDARWNPQLAERLYCHLTSVDAEPMLILDTATERWPVPDSQAMRVVCDEATLCGALYELLQLASIEQCQPTTLSSR